MIDKINNIITYLSAIPAISAIVSTRMYIGAPPEEQTGTYITLNIVSQNVITEVEKRARLEFRYISHNENTTFASLQTLEQLVYNAMMTYTGDGTYKTINGSFINGYDDKKRKILIRDFIINYTND